MSSDTYEKKKVLANGKVNYQAQVWFQGVFYGAKTFDTEGMARKHKENELLKILRGELKPPAERSAQRRIEEALDRPMTYWASLYVGEVGHGESRLGVCAAELAAHDRSALRAHRDELQWALAAGSMVCSLWRAW